MSIGPLETSFSAIESKYKTFFRENAFEYVVWEAAAMLGHRWPIVNMTLGNGIQ